MNDSITGIHRMTGMTVIPVVTQLGWLRWVSMMNLR